jgi:hypothetical protein
MVRSVDKTQCITLIILFYQLHTYFAHKGHLQVFSTFIINFILNLYFGQYLHCQIVYTGLGLNMWYKWSIGSLLSI